MKNRIFFKAGLLCLTLTLILLGSCKKRKTEQQKKFEVLLNEKKSSLKDGYYVIIQVDGCHKCKTMGVAFSKRNLNNPKINFILTSESGMKSIRSEYSAMELEANNIVTDPEASFIRMQFTSGYLTLIKVDDNLISSVESIDPNKVEDTLITLQKEVS